MPEIPKPGPQSTKSAKIEPFVNESGIKPFGFTVLVQIPEIKQGVVIIPDEVRQREERGQQEGVFVEAGDVAFTFEDFPDDAVMPKPGDRIMFTRYPSRAIKGVDGREYFILNDKDILAMFSDDVPALEQWGRR